MSRILAGARQVGAHRRLGSFSFFNERAHGPRWACIGDAACFLDPVFSSGVTLGMVGAARAVDHLLPALARGEEGQPDLLAPHTDRMKHGYDVFATMINAFYRKRLLPDLFFTVEQSGELRRGLTSLLAGDLWREDNVFLEQLWRSRLRVRLEDGVPVE